MRLYLLRHGHSPSLADSGAVKDFDRPLSETGREAVRQTVGYLILQGGRPSLILHSPLRRAAETAQEAADLLEPSKGLEPFAPLSNAMPADELLEELSPRISGLEEALAVGHQPQLGELAAFLTGSILELRAGGIIALELVSEKQARILWSRNPGEAPPPPRKGP